MRLYLYSLITISLITSAFAAETVAPRIPANPEHIALAERVERLFVTTGLTPGREQIGWLKGGDKLDWLKALRGEIEVSEGLMPWILKKVPQVCDNAERGITWPLPPRALIPRTKRRIRIDGKLDERDWSRAWTSEGLYAFDSTNLLTAPTMTWKILWDSKNLYFAFECGDSDIIATQLERDSQVFFDDCVEVFILPDPRFRTYWELVIGPSGAIYDGLNCKRYDTWGTDIDADQNVEGLQVGTHVEGTLNKSDDKDKGYVVEMAVPFSQLPGYSRTKPVRGQTLHFMLARLNKDGEKMIPYSYTPLLCWGHNIWNYGAMELGK